MGLLRRLLQYCYRRDRHFAYFIGIIGLGCMLYTVLFLQVPQNSNSLNNRQGFNQSSKTWRRVYQSGLDRREGPDKGYLSNAMRSLFKQNLKEDSDFTPNIDTNITSDIIKKGAELLETQTRSTDTTFLLDKLKIRQYFPKDRLVETADCQKIFDNNALGVMEAAIYTASHAKVPKTHDWYTSLTKDCENFRRKRYYITSSVTVEEKNFPIAYSLLVYKDVELVERLLRAVYRPQNYYCVHIDAKADVNIAKAITSIARCFPNVFISSRALDIIWGEFSVLEAELVCMQDLWRYKDWKYFINLTGQEFPLKTNLEIVKILRAMKWANIVDGTWVRAKRRYFYRWQKNGKPPPHKIRPIKGSVHVAVNRDFVNFTLHDYRSHDFLEWLKGTEIPDETFFSSLNHNPHLGIPGTFLGDAEEYPKKPSFTRYKNWEDGHGVWVRKCSGKYVRNICILGVGDLHRVKDDIALFANKFHLDYQYIGYDCLEELIYNRTREEYLYNKPVDVSFYSMLDQVSMQISRSPTNVSYVLPWLPGI